MEVETGAFFRLGKIHAWAAKSPTDFSPVFIEILKNLPAN
jgi:hypothetical protein